MTAVEPVGSSILSGTGAPDPEVGNLGDYWFDRASNYLYGPKTQEGGWGEGIELGDRSFSDQFDLAGAAADDFMGYDDAQSVWVPRQIRYVHTQDSPSDTWTIAHNLATKPGGISVVDSADSVVYGNVTYVDPNTLTIEFAAPFGGKAYIS